jgi:quinol monooxygenase YgiN
MSCRVYSDIDNANSLTLVEEWKSRNDLEKHIASDDYRKKLFLMDLSSETPDVRFHAVSETKGMDLIIAVREGEHSESGSK